MVFGDAIKERRQALGLSLRGAAKAVGCDVAYLSRIEAGKTAPSEDVVTDLATVLQVDPSEMALMAGRLPAAVRSAAAEHSGELAAALRHTLARGFEGVCERVIPTLATGSELRAIDNGFPFEAISAIAEAESPRKEVFRPIYHVHKWWAQRLGSVFRAAIIASAVPAGSDVLDLFHRPLSLDGLTIFDPFMGSGTTVGEVHKLGCTAIGRDINPVACRAVSVALGPLDRHALSQQFDMLTRSVAARLQRMYRGVDSQGRPCDVLYFFWVKVVDCPKCQRQVDLFPRYIFTRHADRTKDVPVFTLCPSCGDVFPIERDDTCATCPGCRLKFDPHDGPAQHTTAICRGCRHEFKIAVAARRGDCPPAHRMYAKLVLRENGAKEYLRATPDDLILYEQARNQLIQTSPRIPRVPIAEGRNTRQILNYGYRYWHQLFNDRQLLALTTLASGIAELPAGPARDALALLFSGVLEFNNMFASYKGEGTGAVRHMFSHHILKPERMPIEANPWGTPQSSGAFSTLYRSRLLRAVDYRERPFEIAVNTTFSAKPKADKIFGLSPRIGGPIIRKHPGKALSVGAIYLSCGSSAATDLPNKSIDLVVTDPPFFDNVHYSELADFFHVWQEEYFGSAGRKSHTTRHAEEVQDTDASAFARKLRAVFVECHRVLRDGGRMVFSYHHSREDGWSAIAEAVLDAEFSLVQAQPVKAEMSVASPKAQAKEPIDLDILMVCRKREDDRRTIADGRKAFDVAARLATDKVARFNRTQRRLSRNDVRGVFLSQLLVEVSAGRNAKQSIEALNGLWDAAKRTVEQIWSGQQIFEAAADEEPEEAPGQLQLF